MMKIWPLAVPLLLLAAPGYGKAGKAGAVPVCLQPEPQQRDPYNWQERHQAVTQANAQVHPEYVLLGDSITHHWAGEPGLGGYNRAPEAWNALFGRHKVVNMGFGFDYIDNAYYRIQDGELADATPRVIMVLLGTNNLGHRKDSPETCAANMKALLKLLKRKAPQAKILLLGILPRREADLAAKITATNALYKKLADNKRVFYIEPGKVLAADAKEPAKAAPRYFRDTVHPNKEGYGALVPLLREAFRKVDPEF